ncbi:MAG: DUF86 domain-containing protein [Anaerolineae bacterium]|nr:DUF86 domain-containing protein [Anaerolineae bacterium]
MTALKQLLDELIRKISDVESYTSEGRSVFFADTRTQDAVIRCYEVIGEAVKRMPKAFLARFPEMDWQAVAGFRDFLIHRYDKVDLEIVWAAVEQLPALRSVVETMAADPEVLADDEADFI